MPIKAEPVEKRAGLNDALHRLAGKILEDPFKDYTDDRNWKVLTAAGITEAALTALSTTGAIAYGGKYIGDADIETKGKVALREAVVDVESIIWG
jgi:hypothetical protein